MKVKISKILALLLACVITWTGQAYANNSVVYNDDMLYDDEYVIEGTPNLSRWSYTSSVSEGLSINSSGTATIDAVVTGYQGITTKIVIFIDLQKYSGGTWKKIKTYRDTTNGWYTLEEHTYSGLDKGYKYRVKCTYYVYSGNSYDYFIRYTAEKSY